MRDLLVGSGEDDPHRWNLHFPRAPGEKQSDQDWSNRLFDPDQDAIRILGLFQHTEVSWGETEDLFSAIPKIQ